MNRLEIARNDLAKAGKVSALDNYFGTGCLGGLMILMSVGGYGSNKWIRHLDPDSLAHRDVTFLFWMFGLGVLTLAISILAFRRVGDARIALLKRMLRLTLSELLELAAERETNPWARSILRRRARESGTGYREYIAAVHIDDGVLAVFDELKAVEGEIYLISDLLFQADQKRLANPVSWTVRWTYGVPIVTLIWVGLAASWIWMFPEWVRMVFVVFMFLGLYFPLFFVAFFIKKPYQECYEDLRKIHATIPTSALVRFSGARVNASSLELIRRSKSMDMEAKRGLRVAERVRTRTRLPSF